MPLTHTLCLLLTFYCMMSMNRGDKNDHLEHQKLSSRNTQLFAANLFWEI